MNCLRYWARYVHKGEVKGVGIKNENESASSIPIRLIFIN